MTSAPPTSTPPPVKEPGSNGAAHSGTPGHGHGPADNGPTGHDRELPAQPPEGFPKKRTSIWPFLLDVGVVTLLVSLILLRPVAGETASNAGIGMGVLLFVVALFGWLREARVEYRNLPD